MPGSVSSLNSDCKCVAFPCYSPLYGVRNTVDNPFLHYHIMQKCFVCRQRGDIPAPNHYSVQSSPILPLRRELGSLECRSPALAYRIESHPVWIPVNGGALCPRLHKNKEICVRSWPVCCMNFLPLNSCILLLFLDNCITPVLYSRLRALRTLTYYRL